jgi:uncharacterized oligopeptide transporter (OPT) family protein
MLGEKPRQQAVGHVIGILAGAAAVVPVFYLLLGNDVSRLGFPSLPMPAAQVWKTIAELVAQGISALHPSARWAMLIGAVLGLATTIQFPVALSMSIGALLLWSLGRGLREPGSGPNRIFVEERETLCAGIIAGGSLVGVTVTLLETLVLR